MGTGKWIQAAMLLALVVGPSVAARADESEVDYDTQTGYIRAVRPAQPPGQQHGQSPSVPPGQLRRLQDGVIFVSHPAGRAPDPVRQKINMRTMNLVANDELHPSVNAVVLRAGTGETRVISIMKCSPDSVCLIGDTSPLWLGLVPVVNGSPALPGTQNGGTPPHGRILSMPRGLRAGRCSVVIKAAAQPGEDVLVIRQQGLEPRYVQVRYE